MRESPVREMIDIDNEYIPTIEASATAMDPVESTTQRVLE